MASGTPARLWGASRTFREAMRLMRRHDPQRREDGFHTLRPVAREHIDELIDEFHKEQEDHGLRAGCWS
jgi:hypothetical protein